MIEHYYTYWNTSLKKLLASFEGWDGLITFPFISQGKVDFSYEIRTIHMVTVSIELLSQGINVCCRLTSVGHKDLQGGVLQEVTSGEDGPDLCKQPLAVKTFRVC